MQPSGPPAGFGPEFTAGKRVRLIRCTDEHTNLEPGAEGTIGLVDSMGTAHIKWDNGSRLGMVADAGDMIELIDQT